MLIKNTKYHYYDITNQEFDNLKVEKFVARLKQANLVTKADFDNKLTSFNKQNWKSKNKTL